MLPRSEIPLGLSVGKHSFEDLNMCPDQKERLEVLCLGFPGHVIVLRKQQNWLEGRPKALALTKAMRCYIIVTKSLSAFTNVVLTGCKF